MNLLTCLAFIQVPWAFFFQPSQVLLRRGAGKAGHFVHVPNGLLDHDLFTLVWGPTVAALASILDKAPSESIVLQKALSGYRKCAMIAAHYAMSDVFDNLIISLCKFTSLSSAEASGLSILPFFFWKGSPSSIAISWLNNI